LSDSDHELIEAPEPWEKLFLEAFLSKEAYGTVAKAAGIAGVTTADINRRVKESLTFKTQVDAAREVIKGVTRYEVIRRALEPYERPVFQRGELVGYVQEWDNKHLQWVAERMMPEEFHLPTRIEFAGETDGAINFKLDLGTTTPELPSGAETIEQEEDPD